MMAKNKLPSSELAWFLHVPECKHNGICMLSDFVKHLFLNLVTDRLDAITELTELKMDPNKTHLEFMLSIRNMPWQDDDR